MVAGLGGWSALSLGRSAVSSNQARTGPVWFTWALALTEVYLQWVCHTASEDGDGEERSVDSQG